MAPRKYNDYVTDEDVSFIQIISKDEVFECIVDTCLVGRLIAMCSWFVNGGGYAGGNLDGKKGLLHHIVLELAGFEIPEGKMVDHINRNRLDNRLSNLRIVSASENSKNGSKRINNTSGIPNLTSMRIGNSNYWVAKFIVDGKKKYKYWNKKASPDPLALKAEVEALRAIYNPTQVLEELPEPIESVENFLHRRGYGNPETGVGGPR